MLSCHCHRYGSGFDFAMHGARRRPHRVVIILDHYFWWVHRYAFGP